MGTALAIAVTAGWQHRRDVAEWWTVPSDRAQLDEALAGVAWTGPGEPAGRDIVLIVLDTVRRDRLDLYGYERSTMPRLTRWAEGAVVFDDAWSVAPWTLPAHASLFTGRLPSRHGAHGAAWGSQVEAYALPEEADTLAEQLFEEGWATAAVSANLTYVTPRFGLDQGFELFLGGTLRQWKGVRYPDAERITDLALGVLQAPRDKPLFLFLNYMDAHAPMVLRQEHLDEPVHPADVPLARPWRERTRQLMADRAPPDPELVRSWSTAYDGELRHLDVHLGRLFDALPAHGIDDEDLVIVLSDHGEFLGEHGLYGHGKALHDEVLRIPLVARGAGLAPERLPGAVDTTAIRGLITSLARRDGRPPALLAAARSPNGARGEAMREQLVYAERHHERHHLLKRPRLRERFAGVEERVVLRGGAREGEGGRWLDGRPLGPISMEAQRYIELLRGAPTGPGTAPTPASASDAELLEALGYAEP